MPRLHVNGALFVAERCVDASGGVADPGSFGVAAVLVHDDAVEDQDFLAPGVDVPPELGPGLSLDEGDVLAPMMVKRHDGKPGDETG